MVVGNARPLRMFSLSLNSVDSAHLGCTESNDNVVECYKKPDWSSLSTLCVH